jgi:hypothetical protein
VAKAYRPESVNRCVSFVASNAKAANWPSRIGLIALAFGGLWALINAMFGQRKMVPTPA